MFPESKYFQTPEAYRKALRRAHEPHNSLYYTLVCVIGIFMLAPAIGIGTLFVAERLRTSMPSVFGPTWAYVSLIVVILLGGFVSVFAVPRAIVTWVHRKRIRRSLRQQLREQGMPICPECAYDTTGNEGGTCPECGAACCPIDPEDEKAGPTLATSGDAESPEQKATIQKAEIDRTPRWVLVLNLVMVLVFIGIGAYRWAVPVNPSTSFSIVLVFGMVAGVAGLCRILHELLMKWPKSGQDRDKEP